VSAYREKDGERTPIGCIRVENLRKHLSGRPVLRDVNLEIHCGETVAVVGRSGCGKSVLLKHIIGLMWPDSGRVLIDDISLSEMSRQELYATRHRFGMLFQSAALFDSMSVGENVGLGLVEHSRLSPAETADKVAYCLESVGLAGIEHKTTSELSGGMKKRVGLARAIALDPEVLLFDEPTTGLDPIMSAIIDQVIVDLVDRLKTTAVVVTHDMRTVNTVCHRVAFLHRGIIFAEGTPAEINSSEDPVVSQFISGRADGPIQPV
jgi:phospholipid/cholesterol/gamma-HCH transport system ATP-binding protein